MVNEGLDNKIMSCFPLQKCFRSAHTHLPQKKQKNPFTPWRINMEPENDGLEDDFPFQLGGF